MDRPLSIDLSNCDREKIHLVGTIQSHGYFFAFRLLDQTIYHASENIKDLLGKSAEDVTGKTLSSCLDEDSCATVLKAAKSVQEKSGQVVCIAEMNGVKGPYEIYLFELDGLIAVEIEVSVQSSFQYRNDSRNFVENLRSSESLLNIANLTCRTIRSMIGFDRVMMYQYLPNWDGEVIAEDKSPEAHSFMHHRFPASDIPLPARELYLKNKSRLIVNSSDKAVPIFPSNHYLTRKPIDLSHSKLRAVSPIHLEYLRNMGVASSFSVAVIVEGRLWGLIACHSNKILQISHEIRLSTETIASTFAIMANMKQQLNEQAGRFSFEEKLRSLFRSLIESPSILNTLLKNHSLVEQLFSATGIAVVSSDGVEIAGLTPPESMTLEIASWFKERFQNENKTVIATDNIAAVESQFSTLKDIACGALATYSPLNSNTVFIIFRPEILRTITWGGDPRKILDKRNYQGDINPRKSFESWNETVSGHSKPWEKYELVGAEFLRDFIFNNLIKKERLLDELGKKLHMT